MLFLPLMAIAFTSCNDDDDNNNPQVTISFDFKNGVSDGSTVYVVQPDTLYLTGINVKAVRPNHVATAVGPVSYWLNGYPQGTVYLPPYGVAINSDQLDLGTYTLTAQMGIAEEGCSLATALTSVKISVVADSTDIPTDATSTQSLVEFGLK